MKRNTFLSKFFASLTLCTLLSACADQDAVINDITPDTPADVQPFTISATIGDAVQTRTTLNEQGGRYSMVWAAGDQISVVYPGSGWDVAHRFTLSAGQGTKSGTFTDSGQIHNGMLGQGTDGACATDAPYYIGYYPDATFGTWRSGVFNAWLHATQNYDPNGPDNYPMYAFTTDLSDMKFEGINSVLQLNICSSVGDYKVKYIKVAGAGIAGSAGVVVKTDAEGKPYGEPGVGGNVPNITLVCNDEPISATAKPFYIHLIPGHQSNLTIKLILENAGGTQCVSTFSANNLDFAARGLYPIDLNISKTPAADKTAEPIQGYDLNTAIKKLVYENYSWKTMDYSIKTINFIPNSSNTQGTKVNTNESAHIVYAYREGDVVNVTTLAEKFVLHNNCLKIFYCFSGLEQINGLEYIDTKDVVSFKEFFHNCFALKSLDLSTWDTSSATDMSSMFSHCTSLTSLDLRNFNTSKVTDMSYMFYDCTNLTELNLSSFNTSRVESFSFMFMDLDHLATLDLHNFDMSSANDYSNMFYDSKGLTNVYLPAQFFPSSCYSWDKDWNNSGSIVYVALSGINVNYMLSGTAQGSTCTFHCQEEKDVKILNAIKDTNGDGSGTLNIEYCIAILSGEDIEDLKSIIQTNKEALTSVKFYVEQTRPSDVTADYWITINANTLTVNTDKKGFQMGTPDNSVDLSSLFAECSQLTTIDLSSVTKIYPSYMLGMFIDCYKLEELRFCPYFNIPEDVGTLDMITKVGKDLPAGTKCKIYGCTADVQAKMTSESSDYNVEFK